MSYPVSNVLGPPIKKFRIPVRDSNGIPNGKVWQVSEKMFEAMGRPKYIIEK